MIIDPTEFSEVALQLTVALAHLIWQGIALAFVASVLAFAARNQPATWRYAIHGGALVLMAACLPLNIALAPTPLAIQASIPADEVAVVALESHPAALKSEVVVMPKTPPSEVLVDERMKGVNRQMSSPAVQTEVAISPAPVASKTSLSSEVYRTIAPWVTGLYAVGILVMFARLVTSIYAGQRLRRVSTPVDDPAILLVLGQQAKRLGLRATPAAAYCVSVASPAIVGVLRPMILLPLSLMTDMSPEQIRAVLTHELAHLRRYDPVALLVQRLCEAALFFHPAAWFLARNINLERELCCDDIAIAQGAEPNLYAQALLAAAEVDGSTGLASMAHSLSATGNSPSQLARRVTRLLGYQPIAPLLFSRGAALGFVVMFGVTLFLGIASLRGEEPLPAPHDAVVLNVPDYFIALPQGVSPRDANFTVTADGAMRFSPIKLGGQIQWSPHDDLWPIRLERYPIVKIEYRGADFAVDDKNPVIRLYTSGGFLVIAKPLDMTFDGQRHTLRLDMRTIGKFDNGMDLESVRVRVNSAKGKRGYLEIHDLRFEAAADAEPNSPIEDDAPHTVTVLDGDGEPLAGVNVKIDHEIANFSRSALTDTKGRATVTGLVNALGAHTLRVSKAGFATLEFTNTNLYRQELSGLGLPGRVTLTPAVTWSGWVRDENAKPVQNAKVELRFINMHKQGHRMRKSIFALTDAEGRWQSAPLSQLYVGKEFWPNATHKDFVNTGVYGLVATPTFEQLRDGTGVMTINHGQTLRGVVLDENDQPIEGAEVINGTLRMSDKDTVETDAKGEFIFDSLPDDMQHLTVVVPGKAVQFLRVHTGEVTGPITIRLEPGRVLKLRVVDKQGEPIEGVSVRTSSESSSRFGFYHTLKTDSEGRAEWDQAPVEAADYRVSKTDFASQETDSITADGTEHTIVLDRAVAISGRVLDANTGDAITSFETMPVHQWVSSQRSFTERTRSKAGADGRYMHTFYRADQISSVRVEAPGYLPMHSPQVKIGDDDLAFDFKLQPHPGVSGVVRNAEGQPVEGATVAISTSLERLRLSNGQINHSISGDVLFKTGADGRYQFYLPQDEYTLIAYTNTGYAQAILNPDDTAPDLTLEAWARIEGTIYNDGEPLPGQNIYLSLIREDGVIGIGSYSSSTQQDGTFVFDRVPPTHIKVQPDVSIWRPSELSSGRTSHLDLKPGQTARVDFGKGQTVTGRVVPQGRKLHLNYSVNWLRKMDPDLVDQSTSDYHRVIFDVNGAFRIEGLSPGDYQFSIALHEPPTGPCLISPVATKMMKLEIPEPNSSLPPIIKLGDIPVQIAEPAGEGELAPAFKAVTTDNKPVSLKKLRGQFVVLEFWAAWCLPCIDQIPALQALHEKYALNPRVSLLGLNLDADPNRAAQVIADQNIDWPQALLGDWEQSDIPARFGIFSLPTLYLISPTGEIIVKARTVTEIDTALAAAMAKPQAIN